VLQHTLTQSQDKAFRRISELKEQIELDQLAKKDLEQNYTLMLEERDELVRVLQTKVCVCALAAETNTTLPLTAGGAY